MRMNQRNKISYGTGFNFKRMRNFMRINRKNNKLTRGTFFGQKWYRYND